MPSEIGDPREWDIQNHNNGSRLAPVEHLDNKDSLLSFWSNIGFVHKSFDLDHDDRLTREEISHAMSSFSNGTAVFARSVLS